MKLSKKRGRVLSSEQTTELLKQLKGEEPMPSDNVARKRGRAKIKISEKRKAAMERIVDSSSEDFDVKMTVIQELIPLGLKAVAEELQDEVRRFAGTKHSRDGNNARWGCQNGSVYLRDQKFPVKVPRVRDVEAGEEVTLESYQRLQKPFDDNRGAFRRLLHGLSAHKYQESSTLAAESFGISPSSLSKRSVWVKTLQLNGRLQGLGARIDLGQICEHFLSEIFTAHTRRFCNASSESDSIMIEIV